MKAVIKKNWLTRKKNPYSLGMSAALFAVLYAGAVLFFTNLFSAQDWMAANPTQVFKQHEYWRLWTTLLAHGDLGHLLGNSVIFFPFAYFLMNYFSFWLFPFIGLVLGGLINFLVLKTMPENVELIGISGVVYWLGAAWITLFMLIDHREKWRRKFGHVLFLMLMLFIPDTLKPNISYLSHFLGFALGVISAVIYYRLNRKKIEKAQVIRYVEEVVDHDEWRPDYVDPEEVKNYTKEA